MREAGKAFVRQACLAERECLTAIAGRYVPSRSQLSGGKLDAQSPYTKVDDFDFPSLYKNGKVPIWASMFVHDHLRPAAVNSGVVLVKGQRFGLHNQRHSLSTWLVNEGKVEQSHSKLRIGLWIVTVGAIQA